VLCFTISDYYCVLHADSFPQESCGSGLGGPKQLMTKQIVRAPGYLSSARLPLGAQLQQQLLEDIIKAHIKVNIFIN
jgi:hypothetical protein